MSAKKIQHDNPTGTKGVICHICNKGSLVIENTFGIDPPILQCSECKTMFIKNEDGELKDLSTKEGVEEMEKYKKNKKPGKPTLRKKIK